MNARRRRFYAWGYADKGATLDEIRLLEKSLAARIQSNPSVPIGPQP